MFVLAFNDAKAQQNDDKFLICAFSEKNDKAGYIDVNGQWVIKPQFDNGDDFSPSGVVHIQKGDKWGVIDRTGKIIVEPDYDYSLDIRTERNGITHVKKNSGFGFYDKTGKEIVAPNKKFAFIYDFSGYRSVYQYQCEVASTVLFYENDVTFFIDAETNLRGLIDQTGKIVLEPKFSSATEFGKNGLAFVTLNNKTVCIDQKGEIVFELGENIQEYSPFKSSDFVRIKQNDKWGYMDKTGKIAIEPKYDDAEDDPFAYNDLACVKINGKWGSIDKTGKMIIEPQFDCSYIFYPGEDLIAAKQNGKWGYIDKTGKMVIEPKYDGAINFLTNNLAAVEINGKWGAIDKTGKMVIEPKYFSVWVLSNDYIIVSPDLKHSGIVNDKNETVLDIQKCYIHSSKGKMDVVIVNKFIRRRTCECMIYANGKQTVLKDIFVSAY